MVPASHSINTSTLTPFQSGRSNTAQFGTMFAQGSQLSGDLFDTSARAPSTTSSFNFGPLPTGGHNDQAPAIPAATRPQETVRSAEAPNATLPFAEDFASGITDQIILVAFAPEEGLSQVKRQYSIHESLAAAKSGYFKQLLSSGLCESQDSKVVFNWTEPFQIAFRSVVQYIYYGTYRLKNDAQHTVDFLGFDFYKGSATQKVLADHILIYALADRLLMPGLKAMALESVKNSDVSPYIGHIEYLANVLYDDMIDGPEEPDEDRGKGTEMIDIGGWAKKFRDLKIISATCADKCEQNAESTPQQADQQGASGEEGIAAEVPELPTDQDKPDPQMDSQPPTIAVTRSICEQIVDMVQDPRRDMQKFFATLVHKNFNTMRKTPLIEKLMFGGGPFALDLFRLDGTMVMTLK